jgi:3-methyladenine DNA glycosylase AlkD
MAEQSVALISAASALGGVVLTGAFALLKGRQERLDKQADRDEQRRVMHRESRRHVYAQLLSQYHDADRKLRATGQLKPLPSPDAQVADEMLEAEESVIALYEVAAAVSLEGPEAVSAAADELVEACWSLWRVVDDLYVDHIGSGEPLWTLDSPERDRSRTEVGRAKRSFVQQARSVIGGDFPGF